MAAKFVKPEIIGDLLVATAAALICITLIVLCLPLKFVFNKEMYLKIGGKNL